MIVQKLENVGFTHNEALIYSSLLSIGGCAAGRLIKETGLHRNIVYDNLERLVEKGLVTFIIKDGVKYFSATTPDSIEDIIENEFKQLENRKKLFLEIKSDISYALAHSKEVTEAVLYRGVAGVRWVMKDTLREGKDYVVFGAPQASIDIMSKQYWRNYNKFLRKNKMKIRMIFNEEIRAYGKEMENAWTKIRYISRETDPLTETIIYGDKVAIIIWTPNPVTIFIRDRFISQAYRNYFEILWENAKR